MAYILGFFAADGNMIKNKRGACFIEFTSTDKDIIFKIRKILNSNHKITKRVRNKEEWKPSYRLQIGSKSIFYDLIELGMVPAKSRIIKLPQVPSKYIRDFLRGYFDGDGHVNICKYQKRNRKNKSTIIISGFTSGSEIFLIDLKKLLIKNNIIKGGTLFKSGGGHRLCFSILDSWRLYEFMYKGNGNLYLPRKKVIFERYFKNWTGRSIG